MKSKSMRFRWMSSLKKWVVNNLCCVVMKKNRKGQRCEDLASDAQDKCGDVTTVSAIGLITITSADPQSPRRADLETEMTRLKLQDLNMVTPLGVGGFGRVILIDFGVAKKLRPGKKAQALCGSPAYMAPEIISYKGHNTAADIWSMGVLVYAMLSGSPLFADEDDNNIMQTCDNILKGVDDVVFPNEIQKVAEDFIRKLCRKNPAKRITAMETRRHGWFDQFHWEGLRNRSIEAPFIQTVEFSVDTRNFDCEGFSEGVDYPRTDDIARWDPDF